MLVKSLWLPLSAVCFYSRSTESKPLRASVKEIPSERILENIATACLSVEQCHQKFLSLDTGGYFHSGAFPSKGCFMKNKSVWFGTGGTDEEMAGTSLPGILTRVWCDMEVGTPTLQPPTLPPTISNDLTLLPAIPIELGCLPDRFDNEQMDLLDPTINFSKLYPGQFICSKPYSVNQYRFGVSESGNVIWEDTTAGEIKTIYENKESHTDIFFSLRVDATMVVTDVMTDTILWESAPVDLDHPMSHYPRCLSDHDCPYFHLHSDGVLVMNYIADNGAGWQATNLFKVYDV
jgi:hypothetical protein